LPWKRCSRTRMRVLLDENVDRRLRRFFDPMFEVVTVAEHGWSGKKNGELLRAAEQDFDALVTMDKGIEHQQSIRSYDLGFVLIQAVSNRRVDVEPAMGRVNRALRSVRAGQLLVVRASVMLEELPRKDPPCTPL